MCLPRSPLDLVKLKELARSLARKIDVFEHDEMTMEACRADFADQAFVSDAVRLLLNHYVPDYSGGRLFDIQFDGEWATIASDINFTAANAAYHSRISATHSSLSPAYVLSNLMSVRGDIECGARFESELVVDDLNGAIARLRLEDLMLRRDASLSVLQRFQVFVFADGRAVNSAFRSGRKLRELVPILRQASKFKHWLSEQPPNIDLLTQFYRASTENTWIDQLPSKVTRWMFFTTAGVAVGAVAGGALGVAAGIVLSAADTFLVEKIARGWNPSQFISEIDTFLQASNVQGPRY